MIPQDRTPVHILGASGRSGLALCRALLDEGVEVVPVVRDPARWRRAGLALEPRVATLEDAAALRAALGDARRVVSTAHARTAQAVLDAAPADARFVLMGSTRRFSRFPDAHGEGVAAGEAAFLASGRRGVMLHPTMIYGAPGEQNVQRLAAVLRKVRVLPLPGGGRNLVQPIHQDDVTRAILAALARDWEGPRALVIAGPAPISYAGFVRAIAAAAGLKTPLIVPVPARLLMLAARLSARLPRLPQASPEEVRRLLEDKAFDVTDMVELLGVRPMPLEEGLAKTFATAPPRHPAP